MEKMGVVRPDVTPQLDASAEIKTADERVGGKTTAKIQQLDADFRKQAASQVTAQLKSR